MKTQNESTLAQIRTKIDEILKIDLEREIVKREKLGDLSFDDQRAEFEVLRSFLIKVKDSNLTMLPEDFLKQLNNKIHSVRDIFFVIKEFDVSRSTNPQNDRNNMNVNFQREYQQLFPMILLAIQANDFIHERVSVDQVAHQMQEVLSDVEARAQEFQQLVNKHTTTVNQSANEYGMRRYARIFIDESGAFKRSGKNWFIAGIFLLAMSIGFGILLLFVKRDFLDQLDIIQYSITKLVILSTLFYGTAICFKNFKAHKHNEILNKHRHNALLTFEAFTGSQEDQQTKSAVLLAATQTIFGNQNTGYNDGDGGDSDLPTKIIEIIKSPASKG